MNEDLRNQPDGAEAVFNYITTSIHGMKTYTEIGYVYWPFALHSEGFGYVRWHVTHLHSGYSVVKDLTKARAQSLIGKLRALPLSWDFTEPVGPEWDAVKRLASPIVKAARSSGKAAQAAKG